MRENCTYGSVRGTEDTANSHYDILEQYKVEKRGGCRGSVYSTSGKSTWTVNLADKLSIAHNKAWINRVMRLNKPVYDIGLGKIVKKGAWYAMELEQVANYVHYIKYFLL